MMEYTPEKAGSGQFGICTKCKMPPTAEGHDGCLGILQESIVMNACCGHGCDDIAYIQYWDGACVRGQAAIIEIKKLILHKGNDMEKPDNPTMFIITFALSLALIAFVWIATR